MRWLILTLLFAATTINYLDRGILGVILPEIRRQLTIGTEAYGLIIFVFQIAYGVGSLVGGKLLDRYGTRAGYALSAAVWSAAATLNAVAVTTDVRDPAAVDEYRKDPLVHDRISAGLYTEWLAARDEALAGAADIKVPFLLIVGAQDRLIDPQGAAEFSARAIVDHALRLYQGRYHEPFNDLGADEVFADLAAWLQGRA